ncbi:major facilitator superfamily domain-containing protein 9-like [Branchiostoma floridae]|uniref:Major facilitator superfamily domain-containing protein 9-like n=1 Tax=Branchiostoma floridae TaxID=7739 RepID=A0A9J7LSL2_BRAFL|nr:major facilitator superfamily domain-containing protein 9-like [Branchiostoma floridae]
MGRSISKMAAHYDKLTMWLCFSGFLDLFGVSMIIPLLSRHAKHMGASPTLMGALASTYGGLQLFSSPLIGSWGDVWGKRPMMLLCLLLTTISYTLLGLAPTLTLAILTRILAGIFKHSQTLSKAYLADIVPKAKHSEVFGRFTAFSSMGFIVGPVVGGHLMVTDGGFLLVCLAGSAVFFINLCIVWYAVPHIDIEKKNEVNKKKTAASFDFLNFFSSLKKALFSDMWDLFLVKFLLTFSVLVYRTNFGLVLEQRFNITPKEIGYLISYSGIVGTVSGFGVGRVANFYRDDSKVMIHFTVLLAAAILGMTFTPYLWLFLVCQTVMSFCNANLRVASTNITIERGRNKDTGVLMGLNQSVISMGRIGAPLLGGLAQEVHLMGAGVVGAVFAILACTIMVAIPPERSDSQTIGKEKKEL